MNIPNFSIDFKKFYLKVYPIIRIGNNIDYIEIRLQKPEFHFTEYRENKVARWALHIGYIQIIRKEKEVKWAA